jgi:hypothetical protein
MQAPLRRKGSRYPRYSSAYKRPVRGFDQVKKKVALLPFYNESIYGKQDLAITATEEFRRELSRARDYLFDAEGASIFGSSKDIYAGGGLKLATLARKAKLAGVNLVIYGRIVKARVNQKTDEIGIVRETKSYAETELEIKVFDVQANKEIYTGKKDGNVNDSAHKLFNAEKEEAIDYRRSILRYSVKVASRRFVPEIAKLGSKLDWTGRVAKIIGSKIYINAGRVSGLKVGDILRVLTEGSDIFDPETGAMLGVSKGQVKGTLEIVDYFGEDGTVSVLHSGGSVTEGDFVQLY